MVAAKQVFFPIGSLWRSVCLYLCLTFYISCQRLFICSLDIANGESEVGNYLRREMEAKKQFIEVHRAEFQNG